LLVIDQLPLLTERCSFMTLQMLLSLLGLLHRSFLGILPQMRVLRPTLQGGRRRRRIKREEKEKAETKETKSGKVRFVRSVNHLCLNCMDVRTVLLKLP
jgi:hypothetical protein